MTDEQGSSSGLQEQVSAPSETPAQSAPESNAVNSAPSAESQRQAEKTYTQQQVNAIAAKEARKAAEQAENRLRTQMTPASPPQSAPQTAPSVGGMQQVSPEHIQTMVQQAAFELARRHQAQQIESNWLTAIEAEKQADPEFAELYDALNIESQPGLILAMQGMENKAKVVKDLALNPAKYANILTLAHGGSPKLAERELMALSKSIQANEEAKKAPRADAPLSQLKSSNIGGDDGNYSVTDYRGMDWLRG